MANYFYVKIDSEKMTQNVACEIFNEMVDKNKIRHFDFVTGHVSYNTRGLTDIQHILDTYGITDEEIEIKDEFELAYEAEAKTIYEVIQEEIDKYQNIMQHYSEFIKLPEDIQQAMENVSTIQEEIKEKCANIQPPALDIPDVEKTIKGGFEF